MITVLNPSILLYSPLYVIMDYAEENGWLEKELKFIFGEDLTTYFKERNGNGNGDGYGNGDGDGNGNEYFSNYR